MPTILWRLCGIMEKIKSLFHRRYLVIFSLLFSFSIVNSRIFAKQIGFCTFGRLMGAIGIVLLIFPFVLMSVCLFVDKVNISVSTNDEDDFKTTARRTAFASFVVLFLIHQIFFWATFPGICYYDLGTQIEQYDSWKIIDNHPIIHTLILGFLKNLFENANTGYAIATIIQLIVVEISMSFTVYYCYCRTRSIILVLVTLLFYGVHPVNVLLSLSTTKDILFSGMFLISYICMRLLLEGEQNHHGIGYILVFSLTISILFRNNAKYALILAIPFAILFLYNKTILRKKYMEIVIICVISLVVACAINKATFAKVNAVSGSIKEMLSIPAQELGRLGNSDVDNETQETIHEYISDVSLYTYYLADPMKRQLPFDGFVSKCKHFLFDSIILNIKYPIVCMDAILCNTQGYWDIVHCPYSSERFYLMPEAGAYRGGATLESKNNRLTDYLITAYNSTKPYEDKLCIILLNPALYIWLFILAFVVALQNKQMERAFAGIFSICYLLTLLMGPGAIIRYAFWFILVAPISVMDVHWHIHYK